jgi:DNA-binding GntR family transcriptional regulator
MFHTKLARRLRISLLTELPKPVRAAEIFSVLKTRIVQWEYPPGHRFTEEELCKEFGVSRSPVRETLRMLEENNLVDKIPYRGCTVKQPDLNEINELYDVRIILESAVAEHLATQGMPQDDWQQQFEEWSALAQQASYATIDSAGMAQRDRAFHEALARSTGNRTLYDLLHDINERLHFIRMTDITTVDRLWETCRQHLAILEHIAAADSATARAAMRENIEGARTQVRSAIKEALAHAYMANFDR